MDSFDDDEVILPQRYGDSCFAPPGFEDVSGHLNLATLDQSEEMLVEQIQIKRPDWALIELGALWGSVLIPLLLVSRTSKKAAWLLVPYISSVTFAAILNYKIVQLNPVQ